MQALLLGTSAARPIPRPACRCAQCAEARADARRRRSRTGLRIEAGGEVAFLDVGPDVLAQLEREGLDARVDRVLLTHTHLDHVLGLDDLVRSSGRTDPLPVHAAEHHADRVREIFEGLVRRDDERVAFHPWEDGTVLRMGALEIEGFETGHRESFPTTGALFRLPDGRRIAFATDMGRLPEPSLRRLEDVDLFVGDGTYVGAPGYGHPGTEAVIRIAHAIGAKRVAITHVGHTGLTEAAYRRHLAHDVLVLHDGDDLFAV